MVPGRSSLSRPNSIAAVGHISTIDQSGSKLRLAGWGYWAWRELYGCGAPAGVILWRCAAMIARRSFGASPRPPCQFQRRASTPAQASRLGIVTGRRRQPSTELDAGAHPAGCGPARCLQIPKGFRPTAQRLRGTSYLGFPRRDRFNPNGVVANATVAAPGPPAPKARFNASPGQRPGNGFRYHPRPEKGESNPATFRRRALRSPPHRQMPPLPHRHWRQTNFPCPMQIVAERPRK